LAKLEPASTTYDDEECLVIVTIPPGMAVGAGDPSGFTNPRLSFAHRITIHQGDRTQDFVLEDYAFKREFDYGAPRLNVWRVNFDIVRDAAQLADGAAVALFVSQGLKLTGIGSVRPSVLLGAGHAAHPQCYMAGQHDRTFQLH
jgi:hypothetical protein